MNNFSRLTKDQEEAFSFAGKELFSRFVSSSPIASYLRDHDPDVFDQYMKGTLATCFNGVMASVSDSDYKELVSFCEACGD